MKPNTLFAATDGGRVDFPSGFPAPEIGLLRSLRGTPGQTRLQALTAAGVSDL